MFSHGIERKYGLVNVGHGEFDGELVGEGHRVLTISTDPRDGDPVIAAAIPACDVDLYQCKYCLRPYYKSFIDIRRHMQSAHGMTSEAERRSGERTYRCRICCQLCPSISDGVVHLRSRHPGVVVHGNVWDAYANMERVEPVVAPVNTGFVCRCRYCGWWGSSVSEGREHVLTMHPRDSPDDFNSFTPARVGTRVNTSVPREHIGYRCPFCTHMCDSAADGLAHISTCHLDEDTSSHAPMPADVPATNQPRLRIRDRSRAPVVAAALAVVSTDVSSASTSSPGASDASTSASGASTSASDASTSASDATCVICMHAARDTIAIPCGHLGFCGDCIAIHLVNSRTCPICRARIASVHKVHSC